MRQRDEKEYEDKQELFEQTLAIHRPEVYKEYKEQKEQTLKDNQGYDEIVWGAPETEEEAREVAEIIRRTTELVNAKNKAEDEGLKQELEALARFSQIDLQELGDEDA